ncbi:MAG: energy transducer TonB [Thiohalobacteraceae bacterium]
MNIGPRPLLTFVPWLALSAAAHAMLLAQWPAAPVAATMVAQPTVGTPLHVQLLATVEARPVVTAIRSDATTDRTAEPRLDREEGRGNGREMPVTPPDERPSITSRKAAAPQRSVQPSEAVVAAIQQPIVPSTAPAPERTPAMASSTQASNQSAVIQTELMSLLHRAIDRHKRYPQSALHMGREGAARIDFRLEPDGRIEELSIGYSSGVRALDVAAFRAVQAIAPFTEAARYLERSRLVQVEVVFRLN